MDILQSVAVLLVIGEVVVSFHLTI